MFFSFQISTMLLPPSAARKMRILSLVVCLLPFMVWAFFLAQTNTQGGSNFRGQVSLDSGGSPQLMPNLIR